MFRNRGICIALAFVLGSSAVACDDGNDGGVGPVTDRTFSQIERLGNPLVSEVTFPKRDHGFHNTTSPATDVGNGFRTKVAAFITGVGGRQAQLANTIASVLVPDALIVQTDRPGSSAGWLTWALANGYGGRRLTDDVVDAGLDVIFGDLLSPTGAIPGLSTDNVPANDRPFSNTFPYLAPAN